MNRKSLTLYIKAQRLFAWALLAASLALFPCMLYRYGISDIHVRDEAGGPDFDINAVLIAGFMSLCGVAVSAFCIAMARYAEKRIEAIFLEEQQKNGQPE